MSGLIGGNSALNDEIKKTRHKTDSMKIAHVIPFYHGIGGLQVCVHNISKSIGQRGHRVHVYSWENNSRIKGYHYNNETLYHFRLIHFTYPLCKLWIEKYFLRIQNKHQFDLWQINGGYPYGAVLIDFFIKKQIPCVLRCSGEDIQIQNEIEYGVRRIKKANRLIEQNYKKYSAIVAITETVKKEYLSIGIPDEKIRLIPNGVDIERVHGFIGGEDIRDKHNIPLDAEIILTVGRNRPKKGYSFIPKILHRLICMGLNAYWIIIGNRSTDINGGDILGNETDRLILIEEISKKNNEINLPSDALIHYYKSADVFAMTSLLETFGIVLIEAMAAGLPVVCFDVPGVRDVMNTKCGTACKEGDIESFAHALYRICKSSDRLLLSENCRKYTEQFSWKIISEQYLALYESLI